jgi:hypothetical protein
MRSGAALARAHQHFVQSLRLATLRKAESG